MERSSASMMSIQALPRHHSGICHNVLVTARFVVCTVVEIACCGVGVVVVVVVVVVVWARDSALASSFCSGAAFASDPAMTRSKIRRTGSLEALVTTG